MECIEAFGQDFVKGEQCRRIVSLKEGIHQSETIFIVKNIEVPQNILIFHICSAESHCLVKDGQRITHRSVCLVCDHMKRFVIDGDSFAGSHHTQVLHYIIDCDPVEVICLTTRKDGRKNLVLFSGGKDEYGVCRRFLKGLEKGVEGGL